MAVAVDAITAGVAKIGDTANETISHTAGGSTNYGVVVIAFNDTVESERSATSVTWNGTSMTKSYDFDDASRCSAEIWTLASPSTGTQNIVIDPGGSTGTNWKAWVISLTGVDTTSPIVASGGVFEASPSDVTVSTASDGLVIDICHQRSATGISADGSQSNVSTDGTTYGMSTKAGTGSNVTMTWTYTGGGFQGAHAAISLRPASTAAASFIFPRRMARLSSHFR